MKNIKCDILVIGAGSGGLSVASGAQQMGARVVLVERDKMGGDCLNSGCVPSKALIAAAKAAVSHKSAKGFGVSYAAPKINIGKVQDHVRSVIDDIAPHDSVERFRGLGVDVIKGEGRFTGRRAAEVIKGGKQVAAIKFKYAVVATGSRPMVPPVPGLREAKPLTNENIFDLREIPKSLAVIGGGPIGCEMAQSWSRLGAKVTVVEMLEQIMPHDDIEAVDLVRSCLTEEGIDIFTGTRLDSVAGKKGAYVLSVTRSGKKHQLKASHILVAAGRRPNSEGLGLESAGIELTERGFFDTDNRLRTQNKRVFAIGDVAGGPAFTHMAGYQASIVIRNVLFRLPAGGKSAAVPWATYTDPELAQVGWSEERARKSLGDNLRVLRFQFSANDRAKAERKGKGFVKVMADSKAYVKGVTIVGDSAGEQIQVWSLMMGKRLKLSALAGAIVPYPTKSEVHKYVAGSFYTPSLFSDRTRRVVRFLLRVFG